MNHLNEEIVLIEPECKSYQHSEFNAALIAGLLLAYPNAKILFFSEENHFKEVINTHNCAGILQNDRIVHHNIRLTDLNQGFFAKYHAEKQSFKRIQEQLSQSVKFIAFTSCNSANLWAMRYTWKSTNSRVYIFLHGILEEAFKRPSLRLGNWKNLIQWFGLHIRLPLPPNFSWITLGESIKQNVMQQLPKIRNQVHAINHPYLWFHPSSQETRKEPVIGWLGTLNRGKGGNLLLEILKSLELRNVKIPFELVGFVNDPGFVSAIQKYFKTPLSQSPIARNDFWSKSNQIDYTLFLYESQTYIYKASGALFDAISIEKPIIALRNPFFEYYFNVEPNIGWLCDSLDEIVDCITHLQKNGNPYYSNQVRALISLKQKLSLEQTALELSNILG